MEKAVGERRKAFAAAHRSDKDRHTYVSALRRASSAIAKAEAWQDTCSFLSPKRNPKSVYSFVMSLALLPHLSPLLTFPTVSLPEDRFRSSPITKDSIFLSPGQRPYAAEP